ncbi:MAG: outer rane receptor for ferrienterochelin and colicin [Aliidongia sp.]|jgi:outer membrane receptor for ferrienterochelin and colicins|nr:outer rane receptor for ferrienterochelin and colicin [Aliidongia sp.]
MTEVPQHCRPRSCGSPAIVAVLTALAIAAVPCPVAWAQAIDYGAFEQLLGEPVTASVTGSAQRASDVPATMEIITQDDIRRSGARDIPGILRHVAGVDVLEWANGQADVAVRGYDQSSSPRLLVLIDGRQVYGDYYGFTPWSSLPVELSAIRQIEIVKGPNSALFGFNAVGGVINIITYNPLYDNVNSVSLSGGTQGFAQGSAVTSFKLGNVGGIRLSAGGGSNNDFSTPIPPTTLQSARLGDNHGEADFDGLFRLGHGIDLGIEASHSQADENGFNAGYLFDYFRYRTDSVRGQINADTSIGHLQATAYTNWNWQDDTPGIFNRELRFNNQLSVVQLQDIFKLGSDHTFRATAEYRNDVESTTPVEGARVSYDVLAAGGMWEWRITPDLSLTNAIRLDDLQLGRSGVTPPGFPFTNASWNRSYVLPSYNSGLVWKPGDLDTLRLTASEGVETPSLVAVGAFLDSLPNAGNTGVPNLLPTYVTNYEFGWDHTLPSLDSQFRTSIFVQQSTDVLSVAGGIIQTPTGPFFTPTNIGNSEAGGLELELKGALNAWRWGLSYRAELVTDHFLPFARNGTDYVDFQHSTPVNQVKGNIGWGNGPWEIDGYFQYQSKTFDLLPSGITNGTSPPTTLTPIGGYVSVDGRISYDITSWAKLSVSGQNISAPNQLQTSGPKVERTIFGTVTIGF